MGEYACPPASRASSLRTVLGRVASALRLAGRTKPADRTSSVSGGAGRRTGLGTACERFGLGWNCPFGTDPFRCGEPPVRRSRLSGKRTDNRAVLPQTVASGSFVGVRGQERHAAAAILSRRSHSECQADTAVLHAGVRDRVSVGRTVGRSASFHDSSFAIWSGSFGATVHSGVLTLRSNFPENDSRQFDSAAQRFKRLALSGTARALCGSVVLKPRRAIGPSRDFDRALVSR